MLMEEILYQLIGSLSPHLLLLYMSGGAGFLPSTVVHLIRGLPFGAGFVSLWSKATSFHNGLVKWEILFKW